MPSSAWRQFFAEATLAQKFKTTRDGEVTGGPAYYIRAAFKGRLGKVLAGIFSVLVICALGFMGNMVQSILSALRFATPSAFHLSWSVCSLQQRPVLFFGRRTAYCQRDGKNRARDGVVLYHWRISHHRRQFPPNPRCFCPDFHRRFFPAGSRGRCNGHHRAKGNPLWRGARPFSNEAGMGPRLMPMR